MFGKKWLISFSAALTHTLGSIELSGEEELCGRPPLLTGGPDSVSDQHIDDSGLWSLVTTWLKPRLAVSNLYKFYVWYVSLCN